MQGCALAEPGGPWYLTFALGRLKNLNFFIQIICWAPYISQLHNSGLPSIFLRAQPCVLPIILLHDTLFFSTFQSRPSNAEFFPDQISQTNHSIQRTTGDWFPVKNKCLWLYQGMLQCLLRLLKILYPVLYEINTNFRHVLVIQYSYMCVANDK